MEVGGEFPLLVESNQPISAGAKKEKEETRVMGLIELFSCFQVVRGSSLLKLAPQSVVFIDQEPWARFDNSPKLDQWSACITALDSVALNIARQQFIQH